jgi:CRP-like cAMP-binding protein
MENPTKGPFDPKNFLAKVGTGKTILEFRKNQFVFKQGDLADTVFYIQKGRSSLLSYPSWAKKPW